MQAASGSSSTSLNEELQTVNSELESKVEELSENTDDMKNLLNATDVATLFLDSELHIKRFTEQAKRVIRLLPSDVGRPIGDLVPRIQYDALAQDAREVLRTFTAKEIEIRGEEGTWFFLRILPNRTNENVIDGLVMATEVPIRQRLTLSPQREDRIYDLYIEPMRAPGGEVAGVSCVVTDITALAPVPR